MDLGGLMGWRLANALLERHGESRRTNSVRKSESENGDGGMTGLDYVWRHFLFIKVHL